MQALQNVSHTADDIYNLPDDKRAELINGVIYNMSPPTRVHQEISLEVSTQIHNYIKKNGGKCKVYTAPFAVFLSEDNKTYVEPDISVICDTSKLTDKGCKGAPDWIIEIVSLSSKRMDYGVKLFKYYDSGVKEYWIIDPLKNKITVYNFENETNMEEYTFADKIKVGIYKDLEIDFFEINPINQ